MTPVEIAPDPKYPKKLPYQARQGDIFRDVPSVLVKQRPLGIAREYTPEGQRTRFYRFLENETPTQAFDWAEGEDMIVRGLRGWAVLLTMDCDLDTERPLLTFVYFRPFDASHSEETREKVRRRMRYRAWYMVGQAEVPEVPEGYLDFARLTTVHPDAVDLGARHASMTDEVRDTLRIDFMDFMNLEREEYHDSGPAS